MLYGLLLVIGCMLVVRTHAFPPSLLFLCMVLFSAIAGCVVSAMISKGEPRYLVPFQYCMIIVVCACLGRVIEILGNTRVSRRHLFAVCKAQ